MKPRTFFRLALLTPYLLWVISALIVFALSSLKISTVLDGVLMPVFYYAFGILLWFFPYTILALGLWHWSRNKSTTTLYRSAIRSPLLLFALMLIEVLWVSLPAESITELAGNFFSRSMLLGGFSLVFGYLCAGIALGVFKFMQAKNLIVEDPLPPIHQSSPAN